MNEFKPSVDVLARLGGAIYQNNSMKKTQLHFASRTDWNSFERYLNWLMNKNYMEYKINGKQSEYQLTTKGREMFNMVLKFHDQFNTKINDHGFNVIYND